MTHTADTAIDRILFGDNQFFGVNHMSEDKARAQSLRFSEDSAIIDVLDRAYASGVRTFMCTTHDRMERICEHFRQNQDVYRDYRFFPCMPYAHKYANAVTEEGILGAMKRFLPSDRGMETLFSGGAALIGKDVDRMARLLVDAEMKMFRGLSTPVIFLQNVVTDLLLGIGVRGAFRNFADHVRNTYGAEPGFITMNLPMLVDRLEAEGIEHPIVCANINKAMFRMCGGEEAYKAVLRSGRCRAIAMSVFASGGIPADQALEYVCGIEGVESIVFGASSEANIRATVNLIHRFDEERAATSHQDPKR
jgi:hypothetical protein